MDPLNLVVIAVFFAFLILAFILLYPIYRFLGSEEEDSKKWTRERLERSIRGKPQVPREAGENGSSNRASNEARGGRS